MKIYTGRGDGGTTGLLSGERISKSHERIEAIGDIDELISVLGVLRTAIPDLENDLEQEIRNIQLKLFKLGAQIATWRDTPESEKYSGVSQADIDDLEAAIDGLQNLLPSLKHFLIPAGSAGSVYAHLARSVCRRAERHVVRLSTQISVGKPPKVLRNSLIFLNRLSDYLFALARTLNMRFAIADDLWIQTPPALDN